MEITNLQGMVRGIVLVVIENKQEPTSSPG